MSLATADRHYPAAYARLERSLQAVGFDGVFLGWPPGSFPAGCPSQADVPFAFKPVCLVEARARGFETALWVDANCVVVQRLDELFEIIDAQTHLLFANGGRRVGAWASDAALARLDLSRDEAMHIPEVNAAVIGLNLTSAPGAEFLDRWLAEARHGEAFRGSADRLDAQARHAMKWNRGGIASADPRVLGHRHDQTVAGVLAHRLGMTLRNRGFETTRHGVPSRSDTVIVKWRDA